MSAASTVRSYFWPVLLTVLGGFICAKVVPYEIIAVDEHILGFPDTDIEGHKLRPFLLGLLSILPAIGAWLYRFSGILDRYMARQFMVSFGLCMGTLLSVRLITQLQDKLSDFQEAENTAQIVISYYSVHFPATVIFMLPYSLLLSLLYCLGKMSRHQEIVAMIQTGRSIFRLVMPLIVAGLLSSTICMIFNYHWGPWAEGHKNLILDIAKDGQANLARSVLYRDTQSRRVWLVGAFPYQFEKTGQIHNVTVREFNDGGHPTMKLEADTASWSRINKNWTFSGVLLIDLQASPVPVRISTGESITRDWQETPWQLIKPGLDQSHLGVPELNSWLKANKNTESLTQQPYLTQWHYRFAQPIICLITILIAAPLGIVFSRRGIGGGVAVALFLCLGMLLSSSFFLTFGEAGSMPPALAAWATNLLFALIALYLFRRRVSGRPIYESLKKLLPRGQ